MLKLCTSTCRAFARAFAILIVLAQASIAGPMPVSVESGRIPVVVKNGDQTEIKLIGELPQEHQDLLATMIAALGDPDAPAPVNMPMPDFTYGNMQPGVQWGCGFRFPKSIQFGCWAGGRVCYAGLGADGPQYGCHACNGTNCPTASSGGRDDNPLVSVGGGSTGGGNSGGGRPDPLGQ